jgi:hypothetical protein
MKMAIQITISISDVDQKVLLNDLADIEQWVNEAVTGKIDNCFKRMRSDWVQRLMNDPAFTDPIPSNKEDFINLVVSLPQYQDRNTREAAALKAQP